MSSDSKNLHKNCVQATLDMQKLFPELKRIRGYYRETVSGRYHPHWWLVDGKNNIIDPTKSQFMDNGYGDYIPVGDSEPEPKGKCIICGKYVYDFGPTCSPDCQIELEKLFNYKKG